MSIRSHKSSLTKVLGEYIVLDVDEFRISAGMSWTYILFNWEVYVSGGYGTHDIKTRPNKLLFLGIDSGIRVKFGY